MAIIEELNDELFIRRFEDYKRVATLENPNGNFTRKGLRALFGYLNDLSEEDIKLDVIALCCDFSEYKNLDEYCKDYKTENTENYLKILKEFENVEKADLNDLEIQKDEIKSFIEEEISDKTTLIKLSDDLDEGFIIQSY